MYKALGWVGGWVGVGVKPTRTQGVFEGSSEALFVTLM